MKRKSYILFFISFFVVGLSLPSVLGVANVEYWDEVVLMDDNFTVEVSDTPNLHSYSGARGLDKITPIRIQDTDNESIKIFIAKATYTFSVVFWTECGVTDAVSLTERTVDKEWLKLTTTLGTLQEYSTSSYSVNYNYYDIAMKPSGTGFSGYVHFDVDLLDLTPESLDFGNTIVNINSKQFVSDLSSVVLVDSHVEEHAQYASIVNTNEEATIVVKDVSPNFDAAETACDEASDLVSAHFADVDLGVKRGVTNPGLFLQQGKTTIPRGSVDDISSKGVYIALVPDVTPIDQEIIVRSQDVTVDTKTQLFSAAKILESSSVRTETEVVTIGVDVTNYAILLDLEANFLLYSTCEVSQLIEDDKPPLDIPDSELEDIHWDNYLEGEVRVDLPYNPDSYLDTVTDEFWAQYGTTIIIAGTILLVLACVAAFFYVKFFTPIGFAMSNMSNSGNSMQR